MFISIITRTVLICLGNTCNSEFKTSNDHHVTNRRWHFIVPPIPNDVLNDSLKDSCKGLKGSKKEMRKLKKQIAARQRRLYAIHQHVANKMHSYEDYGHTSSPVSPFQITQWSKQLRQKAKKVGHFKLQLFVQISLWLWKFGQQITVKLSSDTAEVKPMHFLFQMQQ